MKTTIDKEGVLTITPENELEEYALNKWAVDNISHMDGHCLYDNLIICEKVPTKNESNKL